MVGWLTKIASDSKRLSQFPEIPIPPGVFASSPSWFPFIHSKTQTLPYLINSPISCTQFNPVFSQSSLTQFSRIPATPVTSSGSELRHECPTFSPIQSHGKTINEGCQRPRSAFPATSKLSLNDPVFGDMETHKHPSWSPQWLHWRHSLPWLTSNHEDPLLLGPSPTNVRAHEDKQGDIKNNLEHFAKSH